METGVFENNLQLAIKMKQELKEKTYQLQEKKQNVQERKTNQSLPDKQISRETYLHNN